MRLFEEFVEALKNEPEKAYGAWASSGDVRSPVDHKAASLAIKQRILAQIKNTNLFVLAFNSIFRMEQVDVSGILEETPHLHEDIKNKVIGSTRSGHLNELDLDVAAPLKTCWFQFPEGGFRGIVDKEKNETVFALFLHEIEAHEYLFTFVKKDRTDGFYRFQFGKASFKDSHKSKVAHDIWHTISIFLQPFAKDYTGASMKTSARVKYKDPVTGEKIHHKLRRVIMIYPKKMTKEDREAAERDRVDFTHRFNVRAHYRRLFFLDGRTDEAGNKLIDFNRIGKNREGEYVVAGFTYVEEGEKGPEHAPFVRKTRVVLGERVSK